MNGIDNNNEPDRLQLLSILKSLLPGEFGEVVFHYNKPSRAYLTGSQVEQAIAIIQYAEQVGELTFLSSIVKNIRPSVHPSIFVSYAHKDKDWTTGLIKKLQTRLAQTQNGGYLIELNENDNDNLPISPENIPLLENARILVMVLSSSYFKSWRCSEELKRFVTKKNYNLSAVFIVEKEQVELPRDLLSAKRYPFWRKQHYVNLPLCLRDDIITELREENRSISKTTPQVTVFLAEVSSANDDLWGRREDLKRYLEHNDIKVLPGISYQFLDQVHVHQSLDMDLKQSTLFIQLIGQDYSSVPTGIDTASALLEQASQHKNLTILQWIHPNFLPHKTLLNFGNVIALSFGEFKQIVIQMLESHSNPPSHYTSNKVFINSLLSNNNELVNSVTSFLTAKDIRCFVLKASKENINMQHQLQQQLCSCTAVIIICDNRLDEDQVYSQLRYCHHMQGLRNQSLKVIAVCCKENLELNANFPNLNLQILECHEAQLESSLSRFIQALQV